MRNFFFFAAGIVFLALAKAKNVLRGYATPKPFDVSETDRCVEYDFGVVDRWLSRLEAYAPDSGPLEGKSVLELGPGSDLGIGLYLLSKGCATYHACDVNPLMDRVPDRFYEAVFARMAGRIDGARIEVLREQLREARAGRPSRLAVVVREDFDLGAAVGEGAIDRVFSQAAFEHFDDVEATVGQLGAVCKPGAILVAEVDLKTHSRWICDRDPNNIYRYPAWLYRVFRFRGSPNRLRPFHYAEILERNGWTDVRMECLNRCGDPARDCSGLDPEFTDLRNQMDWLSMSLCARKK
jgi:SAM-dependent methyltransferase